MDPVVFSMRGEVRGKGRPRFAVRGGFAKTYTDELTRAYESAVRQLGLRAMHGRQPFVGALSVSLRFRLSPPKSMSKRLRASILAGETAYFGRIDADNAGKAILDGLNGACFVDDKQIMRLWIEKVAHERPGIDVKITPLGEP